MQLQVALDVMIAQYPWFQSASGQLLQKMLKAFEKFSVCAAVNPCTRDYLFAFTGFGRNFSFPLDPPLKLLLEEVGIKSIAW